MQKEVKKIELIPDSKFLPSWVRRMYDKTKLLSKSFRFIDLAKTEETNHPSNVSHDERHQVNADLLFWLYQ